jgi:hypothetical protein
MTAEKDRQFLRIAKRDDMRVILAFELGRFGYEKKQILEMDEEVAAGRADVLITDDTPERVLLRIGDGRYLNVTETGLFEVEPGSTH